MRKRSWILETAICFSILWGSCTKDNNNDDGGNNTGGTPQIVTETLVSGQGIVWGFDVLPDGRLLYTQKSGNLRIFTPVGAAISNVSGLPANISSAGQGGLLDVCISPDFVATRHVYITYSITGGFLQLARFTLNGTAAEGWTVLKTTESASTWNGHFGSRIAIGPDGYLYWSVGEGGGGTMGGASSPHQNGQRLNTMWGKIHRMSLDGNTPPDNPLFPGSSAISSLYSIGHRNPQGIAFEPETGSLYASEHGPNGGCELNLIQPGRNYGWPLYSNGTNYNGSAISNGHNAPGITAPLKTWTPALAPSGITFINHPSFKDWNGNLLIASLGRRQLLMVDMSGGTPGRETVLLENIGRVRNVKMSWTGRVYASLEDDGRIIEITAL